METLSCELFGTMQNVDNFFGFGKDVVLEIYKEQLEQKIKDMPETINYINKPLSPYLSLAKQCYEMYGKKWAVQFFKERLNQFKEEKCRRLDFYQKCLVRAHKDRDASAIAFINNIKEFPTERDRQLDRDILHHERVIRFAQGKKKKDDLTELDIESARGITMDELVGLGQNRSRFVPCPFHKEKTPSCKIYKNNFYCFGCGEHGSPIDWVMKTQEKKFKDAVLFILKR